MNKEKAEKIVTITLTDERPVKVKNGQWPVMASASNDRDHNNQEIFRRHYLRVRIHDTGTDLETHNPHPDGRCLVYGWYESSYQGESGAQAGYRCQIEDVVPTIRQVGERINAPQWLADECVADLPAVEEEKNNPVESVSEPLEALCVKWIADERQYRSQVDEARKAGTPHSGMLAHADQLAECRRQLQEAAHLVVAP